MILGVDKIFHDAYFASAWYKQLPEDIRCAYCATPLKVYYAEDKLYAVKCPYCEIVTLIKANSPIEAAKYVGKEWRKSNE